MRGQVNLHRHPAATAENGREDVETEQLVPQQRLQLGGRRQLRKVERRGDGTGGSAHLLHKHALRHLGAEGVELAAGRRATPQQVGDDATRDHGTSYANHQRALLHHCGRDQRTAKLKFVGGSATQRYAPRVATSGLGKRSKPFGPKGTARWPWVGDPVGGPFAFERARPCPEAPTRFGPPRPCSCLFEQDMVLLLEHRKDIHQQRRLRVELRVAGAAHSAAPG
eukprot:scaffold8700_cov62-Phaeocystis_antarctica.AAC.4